jgi:hypothetical protein
MVTKIMKYLSQTTSQCLQAEVKDTTTLIHGHNSVS